MLGITVDINWTSGQLDKAPMVTHHPVETDEDVLELKGPNLRIASTVPVQTQFHNSSFQESLNKELFDPHHAVEYRFPLYLLHFR